MDRGGEQSSSVPAAAAAATDCIIPDIFCAAICRASSRLHACSPLACISYPAPKKPPPTCARKCAHTRTPRRLCIPQIGFAEACVECRRTLLMQHFGETGFTPADCGGTCDVCEANAAAGLVPEGERGVGSTPAQQYSCRGSMVALVVDTACVLITGMNKVTPVVVLQRDCNPKPPQHTVWFRV
jgi:RecQ zinc-binding